MNQNESRNHTLCHELVEQMPEGVILLDHDWNILTVNRFAELILMRSANELTGKNLWQEFSASVGNEFHIACMDALHTGSVRNVEAYIDALQKWIKAGIYPLSSGIGLYFHDISVMKEVEKTARANEEKYRMFLERVTDGFIALDKNFNYTYVNKRVGEMVQRDPASLIGKNIWEEFPELIGSYTYKAFQTAMKEQRFISNMDFYEPMNLWFENYIYPSPEGLSVFIKDITEQKKLEAQLHQQERLRQLQIFVTSLEAQEKERTSIGMELHDNVNQVIVATKIMLSHLIENPANAKEIAEICINNLEKVIFENRRLAHELVTPDLGSESLVDEMSNLVITMFNSGAISARIDASQLDESLLSEKIKLTLYRIAQEQYTNIIKHAKATKVKTTLYTRDDIVSMTIEDDGNGLSNDKPEKGIGLKNIDARAKVFNGTMEIHTEPGKGFRLDVEIPL